MTLTARAGRVADVTACTDRVRERQPIVRDDRGRDRWLTASGRRSQQIPPVARHVYEHSEATVRRVARSGDEVDPGGLHAGVLGIEVVDSQEEPDTPGVLLPNDRALSVAVSLRQQESSPGAWRPNDDPALRSPVIGRRRRVLDQLKAQSVNEEVDGQVVVVDDKADELEMHASTAPSGSPSRNTSIEPGIPPGRPRVSDKDELRQLTTVW